MKTSKIFNESWDKLENFLNSCVEDDVFPGANFAIVLPDEVKQTSVGFKQIVPTKELNSIETIYDLASITKVLVTTTCILKLMEEGLISLKTKMSEIIDIEEKEITIKDCITHTSGLPIDINNYKTMTTDEMYDAIKHAKCEYPTGSKVRYSDVNFIMLGLVINKLKGDISKYADEVIFKPLDMKDTCFNPDASLYERCAAYENIENRGGIIRGIVHDGKAFKFNGISGHAGAFSTLEDMSHFVQMLLNDGVYNGKRFFSSVTMDLLRKCQTSDLNEKRSIGWIISDNEYALGDYYSDHTLYHTGFAGCSLLIDLDRKVGFICLCNRVHPSRLNKKILFERNRIHNLAYQCIK